MHVVDQSGVAGEDGGQEAAGGPGGQGLEQDAIDAQQQVESLVAARESAVKVVAAERAAERSRLAVAQAQSRALAKSIEAAANRAASPSSAARMS